MRQQQQVISSLKQIFDYLCAEAELDVPTVRLPGTLGIYEEYLEAVKEAVDNFI